MSKVVVSEKTLELNVSAEVLAAIRAISGCSGAFWIGMKQAQEARNGIDELISNVPFGRHLALQFKAPRPSPKNGSPFRFPLNPRQFEHLRRLALGRPGTVYYCLPGVNTFQGMRGAAPKLIDATTAVDVCQIPNLSAINSHHFEVSAGRVSIRSEPIDVPGIRLGEALQVALGNGTQNLLSNEELRAWFENLAGLEDRDARRIAHRLRGFGTVCVS